MLGEGNIETASNCLILHTVSDCDDLPFIALQVQGGLQTVEISEDTLRDDYKWQHAAFPMWQGKYVFHSWCV